MLAIKEEVRHSYYFDDILAKQLRQIKDLEISIVSTGVNAGD